MLRGSKCGWSCIRSLSFAISRFISEHRWFKVYAPFPPYKYQQLMTCRECHLICHDDKMPPQFMLFFIMNGRLSYVESSLVLLHILGEIKILLTFQRDSHFVFEFVCLFFFFYKIWKVNIQIAINLPVELNLNNFCEFSIKFWLHYVIRVHTAKNAVQYWI